MAASAEGLPIRIIVNPTSGRGGAVAVAERAGRLLRARGVACETRVTRSAADAEALAREAARDGCPLVVAIGGDGLVSRVARGLLGSDASLGIVPAGDGNDFARGLGIPLTVTQATGLLVEGDDRRVDVGLANDQAFLSVAVTGLAADVSRRAGRSRWLPAGLRYVVPAVAEIVTGRPRRFRITGTGQDRSFSGWLVAVGNTGSAGRGMALLPAARPDDGLLDVCLVEGVGALRLLCLFPRVFRGTHVHHRAVRVLRGPEFRVAAEEPSDVHADGEHLGSLPMAFRVLPRALTVRIPSPGSAEVTWLRDGGPLAASPAVDYSHPVTATRRPER